MATTAKAHPNIALVKYWGKQDKPGNYPATPSLSVTLDTLETTTTIETSDRDQLVLNGTRTNDPKVGRFLVELRETFDVPPLAVNSNNNFPTGAGLASSASGFAALITAIDAHCELELSLTARSSWARRGSGSAARSVAGGFVALSAPDWQVNPLESPEGWPLKVVVAITDEARKPVPSTEAMERTRQHSPYFSAWTASATADLVAAMDAVALKDFDALARVAESSCLKMHGLMLSTGLVYWNAGTLESIRAVQRLQQADVPVFFTIDAGPQVKALCLPKAADAVAAALEATPGVRSVISTGLGPGAAIA